MTYNGGKMSIETKLIEFEHANLKRPVYINKMIFFGAYFSDADKSVHLVGNGGAIIPVAGTLEEALQKINNKTQGETNG